MESESPLWHASMNSTLFGTIDDEPKDYSLITFLFPKQYSYMPLSLVLLFTCIVTHFLYSNNTKKPKLPLPPGPSLFTMLANLFEFIRKPQQTLAKIAKIYAPDIMLLRLGQSTTVIISSPNIAKEVLQTKDLLLSDRTVPSIVTSLDHHNYSLPFLPVCPLWKDLRKICNEQLFSTKVLDLSQGLRRKKLLDLLGDMQKYGRTGDAVDVGHAAFRACINFLSNTFVSEDFVESVENGEYKDIVSTLLKLTGATNVVDIFPFLKVFDPQGLQRHTIHYLNKFFHNLDKLIEKRLKLREEGHYVTNNDMLDALLDISHQDSQRMDRKKIKHFLLDLLVAGTDTTAYGLERAMTEVLHNPEVMSKAKQELEQNIGRGNPIDESDVAKLPYLQAIVKESLRLHPPAPLLLPRKAKVDVEISGYRIPKNARVLINEWAIGRNPNVWDNANSFLPERLLGSKIDVKGRDFQLTPFGSGRRICPGSPLAMRMIHVMLGSLLNSFDWKLQSMDKDQPLQAIPLPIIINN
ncbi:7-ethoxycoumarin O-deethylase-like [Arachis stenosperma]|uniref:7-ethoxycoumarin O-deethylase-like n=1 Tax=Arachis stenosperma TaxID=217475 RepID=UPI0025AD57FF|nr:7-ethoxycoumarin O-deethylase-like [Arachis stenosperma]